MSTRVDWKIETKLREAIEFNDKGKVQDIMLIEGIGFDYKIFGCDDLLLYSLSKKAYSCSKYFIKHIKVANSHIKSALLAGEKYVDLILENKTCDYQVYEILSKALYIDEGQLFYYVSKKYPKVVLSHSKDLLIDSLSQSNTSIIEQLYQIEAQKEKNSSVLNYVISGIIRFKKWKSGFDILLKIVRRTSDISSFIKEGKTIYTELAEQNIIKFDVNDLTEIYLKLMENGFDVTEKEKCKPFRAGYETIPVKCNTSLWNEIFKLVKPIYLIEKFILGNISGKMRFLLREHLKIKDPKIIEDLWNSSLLNECYNSAAGIHAYFPRINVRVFIEGIPLLEKMKKANAKFALKYFMENSLGFAEADFDRIENKKCINYFQYAIDAQVDFDLILKKKVTHVPTLIYSLLCTPFKKISEKNPTNLNSFPIEILKRIKEIVPGVDLGQSDEKYRLVSHALESGNKSFLTKEVIEILVEYGAKIHHEDILALVSMKELHNDILEYMSQKVTDLRDADDNLRFIEVALETFKPPTFIEMLLKMGAKYEGDLNLTSWITRNCDYKEIDEVINLIIEYKYDLSKYDHEKKYFHCLMTTFNNVSIPIKLLEKLKTAGADPKNKPSISILFKKFEKGNPYVLNIPAILQFFIKNEADISDDDKENCILSLFFDNEDTRIRNIEILRDIIKLGAKGSSCVSQSIFMKMINYNILASEYYEAILKTECNIDVINSRGETFLTRIMKVMGISERKNELIKLFIKYGADPSIKDDCGYSAVQLAKLTKDLKALEIMEK